MTKYLRVWWLLAGLALVVPALPAQNFITVTTEADDGPGSLRAAVAQARDQPGPDRIRFVPGLGVFAPMMLTSGVIDIGNQELEIEGDSPNAKVWLSGQRLSGILKVPAGGILRLKNLLLEDGLATRGGGLENDGLIEVTDCVFKGCGARDVGGAVHLASPASLGSTFHRCAFVGNYAKIGGAVMIGFTSLNASATFFNCTFATNFASGGGGAIAVAGQATGSFEGCTIVRNFATGSSGGITVFPAAQVVGGTLRMTSCVVANNFAPVAPDLSVPTGHSAFETGPARNLIGRNDGAEAFFPVGPLTGTAFAPLDPLLIDPVRYEGTFVCFPLPGSPAIDATIPVTLTTDQLGRPRGVNGASDIGAVELGQPEPTRARLLNVSTRLRTEGGDNVAIVGFSITGASRKIVVRALGPSLSAAGLTGVLSNPTLELFRSGQSAAIAFNNDWRDDENNAQELMAVGLAPGSILECGLVRTLEAGNYTAIVRGTGSGGPAGTCLVEVYDKGSELGTQVRNLSTRGQVGTGDNVMIAGFVVSGGVPKRVLIRVLGPSLVNFGVPGVLVDPMVEVRSTQEMIGSNDDWRGTQAAEVIASGFAPSDERESAVVLTLPSGSYTAIVRGKAGATGNAIVEVYELQ